MENESLFRKWMNSFLEFLNEQQWFEELKSKWNELDPQSQNYVKLGILGSTIIGAFLVILTSLWSIHSLKSRLSEKQELLTYLHSATDELRRLQESSPTADAAEAEGGTWNPYFETIATTAGMDKEVLSISEEKPGPKSPQSKEDLYELSLKHVNIKQVVRYAFLLENGKRPVKLRNLMIDTKADPSGYMNAVLAVSAFTVLQSK